MIKDIALALALVLIVPIGFGIMFGGDMKERNFELSPLSEREFSLMIVGVSDDALHVYESWIAEEMNRRGIDSKFDDLTLAYQKGFDDGRSLK